MIYCWFDGVLTSARMVVAEPPEAYEFYSITSCHQVVAEPPEVRSWIVCDGDIDPEWIESLNSVLDDNRLLTMPSGERIQFGPNVNFIFETHSLKFASPATVSRMGMIFLDQVANNNSSSSSSNNNSSSSNNSNNSNSNSNHCQGRPKKRGS